MMGEMMPLLSLLLIGHLGLLLLEHLVAWGRVGRLGCHRWVYLLAEFWVKLLA